jgi:arginase
MTIHILGVPMDLGAGRRGVDMGPSAIRIAGLAEKLTALGHAVSDEGDIAIKSPEQLRIRDQHLRYLPEIVRACTIRHGLENHEPRWVPVLGRSLHCMGTIAGLASYAREHSDPGVLWIDAHGDMNTDKTSPSGNIHGMPLAASVGLGALELRSIGSDFRKVDPRHIALVGVRDLDSDERKVIRQQGMHVFTMKDIDNDGMGTVIRRALRKLKGVDCCTSL